MNIHFDPKQLQLGENGHFSGTNRQPKVQHRNKLPRHKQGEPFLKGPIPLAWLSKAASLPGKAVHLGLAVWYGAGLKKSATVAVSRKWLTSLGMNRYAAYRALKALEQAGLVSVIRHRGRKPVVTLLEVNAKIQDASEVMIWTAPQSTAIEGEDQL